MTSENRRSSAPSPSTAADRAANKPTAVATKVWCRHPHAAVVFSAAAPLPHGANRLPPPSSPVALTRYTAARASRMQRCPSVTWALVGVGVPTHAATVAHNPPTWSGIGGTVPSIPPRHLTPTVLASACRHAAAESTARAGARSHAGTYEIRSPILDQARARDRKRHAWLARAPQQRVRTRSSRPPAGSPPSP